MYVRKENELTVFMFQGLSYRIKIKLPINGHKDKTDSQAEMPRKQILDQPQEQPTRQ